MKVSILSLASFALTLLSSGLVHSFPTAENFAKLAHRNALDNAAFGPEDLHNNLLRLKQKRLLFDPMTTPIDGTCPGKARFMSLLTPDSVWKTRLSSPELRQGRPTWSLPRAKCPCVDTPHLVIDVPED